MIICQVRRELGPQQDCARHWERARQTQSGGITKSSLLSVIIQLISNPVIHSYNVIKLIISYRVVQLISNPVIQSYNVIKLIISYPGIQLISYIVIQSYSESVIYSSSFSVIQSSSSPGYHQAIQSSSQPLIKTITKVNHYIFQDIFLTLIHDYHT